MYSVISWGICSSIGTKELNRPVFLVCLFQGLGCENCCERGYELACSLGKRRCLACCWRLEVRHRTLLALCSAGMYCTHPARNARRVNNRSIRPLSTMTITITIITHNPIKMKQKIQFNSQTLSTIYQSHGYTLICPNQIPKPNTPLKILQPDVASLTRSEKCDSYRTQSRRTERVQIPPFDSCFSNASYPGFMPRGRLHSPLTPL